MQQVALLPVELGADLCLASEQPLGPARSGPAAAQILLEEAVDLVTPLFARAQLPSGDHQGIAFGRRHRRHMDLAQIHSRHLTGWKRRGQGCSGVERQAELVVLRPPGQCDPTPSGSVILRRQQQGWALDPVGRRSWPAGATVSAWSFQITVE